MKLICIFNDRKFIRFYQGGKYGENDFAKSNLNQNCFVILTWFTAGIAIVIASWGWFLLHAGAFCRWIICGGERQQGFNHHNGIYCGFLNAHRHFLNRLCTAASRGVIGKFIMENLHPMHSGRLHFNYTGNNTHTHVHLLKYSIWFKSTGAQYKNITYTERCTSRSSAIIVIICNLCFPINFISGVITVSIIYGRAPANWNNASSTCRFLRKSSRFIVKIAMTRTAMAAANLVAASRGSRLGKCSPRLCLLFPIGQTFTDN